MQRTSKTNAGAVSAPDGSSAGAHFNPTQAQHGNPTGAAHHAGDMVNIRSNAEGVAQVDTTAAGMALNGDPNTDVMGKAIVVHESPDDYTTQPSGNSGKLAAMQADMFVVRHAASGARGSSGNSPKSSAATSTRDSSTTRAGKNVRT